MGSIEALREIGQRLDVRDVAEYLGLTVNKAGKILCPYHREKSPSCQLYGNRFYCFGCGQHGDGIDLVAAVRGVSKWDAAAELNSYFSLGIDLDGQKANRRVRKKPTSLNQTMREQVKRQVDDIAETAWRAWQMGFPEETITWLDDIHQELLDDSDLLKKDPALFVRVHRREIERYADFRSKFQRQRDAISNNGEYPYGQIWVILGRTAATSERAQGTDRS